MMFKGESVSGSRSAKSKSAKETLVRVGSIYESNVLWLIKVVQPDRATYIVDMGA